MTRTTRDPVALDDRPVMVRRADADAFVSIHLNAFPDGVESVHRRRRKRHVLISRAVEAAGARRAGGHGEPPWGSRSGRDVPQPRRGARDVDAVRALRGRVRDRSAAGGGAAHGRSSRTAYARGVAEGSAGVLPRAGSRSGEPPPPGRHAPCSAAWRGRRAGAAARPTATGARSPPRTSTCISRRPLESRGAARRRQRRDGVRAAVAANSPAARRRSIS